MESGLLYHFLMLGAGVLLPWSAISTSFDWMSTIYPQSYRPSLCLTVINFVPTLVFMPLAVAYGSQFSFNTRILTPFLVLGVLLTATPFIVRFVPHGPSFFLMCFVSFAMGSLNSIAQTSVFSLAGCLSSRYTNSVMIGSGLVGVLICVIRCICLGVFGSSGHGLLLSSIAYFVVAGVAMLMCIFSQWRIMKNDFVRDQTEKTWRKISPNDLITPLNSTSETEKEVKLQSSFTEVYSQLWQQSVLVFVCFVVTFGVFPTGLLAAQAQDIPYVWFVVLLFLTFNVCDFVGRSLPAVYLAQGQFLWLVTLSRLIFWVTFPLVGSEQPPNWLFDMDATWFKFLNVALFGLTNGFCCTCSMILGPVQVQDAFKDRAGSIMSTSLVWGIVTGSVLAFCFTPLLHPPTSFNLVL